MFGKNEKVGQKWFREKPESTEGKLFVTSIFYTLQGEGPFAAMPAVFVRLAKCNLDCSFCDTFFDDGEWLSYDEIEVKIQATIDEFYQNYGIPTPKWANWDSEMDEENNGIYPLVGETRADFIWKPRELVLVMTGGEPMLQQNLVEFLKIQDSRFYNTQIESNGTIWQDIPQYTTLVISPKVIEKNGKEIKYFQPSEKILERADALKFVVSSDPDSIYYNIPEWADDYRDDLTIYVSPMNIYNDIPRKSKELRMTTNRTSIEQRSTVDEVISFWEPDLLDLDANQKNHEYVAKLCMINGYKLNLQQHLYASLA